MTSRPAAGLAVRALSHRYPGTAIPALTAVSFQVEPGERVGLLGPNGAGKSTLMRLACGYLPVQRTPDTDLRVGDIDVTCDSLRARAQVGYLPEQVPLYPELRVREHLEFRAAIKGVRRRDRAGEVRRVAERTGLDERIDQPIHQLSRGYRQRVGIADALLGAPPLVVLDEPTVGLDPNQVLEIRAMLRALGGSQTLIFSSHILAEVEAVCDRVIILAHGRCVADESVDRALQSSTLVVQVLGPATAAATVVQAACAALGSAGATVQLPPARVDGDRTWQECICIDTTTAEALARAIGQASITHGIALARLELTRRRLEERFARVTGAIAEASP